MVSRSRHLASFVFVTCLLIGSYQVALCQESKPGLPGMAPSRWITIKNTQAPGRVYRSFGGTSKRYKQEDVFFKLWIPVVYKPRFAFMLGPQYRTEQLEFRDQGENALHKLSNWNLRSLGLDVRSTIKLDSTSWLLMNMNFNQSGNLQDQSHENVPLNYTFSTIFLKKKSANKEIGIGFMANKSFNSTVVLPVLIFNYNYSSKAGFEITLPRKIAWRHNLTGTDILYAKAEAISRAYFIVGTDQEYAFRRTELDMGIAYNKQFNKFMGAEVFGGYRRNINTRLPGEVIGVKTSGLVFSFEIYFRPPTFK